MESLVFWLRGWKSNNRQSGENKQSRCVISPTCLRIESVPVVEIPLSSIEDCSIASRHSLTAYSFVQLRLQATGEVIFLYPINPTNPGLLLDNEPETVLLVDAINTLRENRRTSIESDPFLRALIARKQATPKKNWVWNEITPQQFHNQYMGPKMSSLIQRGLVALIIPGGLAIVAGFYLVASQFKP